MPFLVSLRQKGTWLRLVPVALVLLLLVVGCGRREWSYGYAPGERYTYDMNFDIDGHLRVMGLDLPVKGSSNGTISVAAREGSDKRLYMAVNFDQHIRMKDPTGRGGDLTEEMKMDMELAMDDKGNIEVIDLKTNQDIGELDPLTVLEQGGLGDNTAWMGPSLPEAPPEPGETWTVKQDVPLPSGKTTPVETVNTFVGYQTLAGVEYAVIESQVELKTELADLLTEAQQAELPEGVSGSIILKGKTVSYIGRENWILERADQTNRGTIRFTLVDPDSGLPFAFEMEIEMKGEIERQGTDGGTDGGAGGGTDGKE